MQTPLNPGQALAAPASDDGHGSGVSWAAVFAGATAAAALSFILLLLGVGLGLSSISPYSYNPTPLTGATIAWIAFIQLAASGTGGYIAGRLRVKWTRIHGDEVHFRDTAHGLLAWAVATLITVALLAGGIKAALGGAIDAGSAAASIATPVVAAGVTAEASSANRTGYFSDMLLRSPSGESITDAQRTEISRIVISGVADGQLTADDRAYLAQVVAKRTGMSQIEAERRVDEIYARAAKAAADVKAKALQMADDARRTAAHSALWMFVALLFGAFIASLAATAGGRRRDDHRVYVRSTIVNQPIIT